MQRTSGYSATQIALHWIVAVLVAAQYIFHDGISTAWEAYLDGQAVTFSPLVFAHVAGGVLIFVLVSWRLTLRLKRGAPPPPENEPAALKVLSRIAHWAFYVLLAAMAVTGGLAWFGDVVQAAQAHNLFKVALLALIVLHIVAVPFHKIVLKNNLMVKMIRPDA